MDTMSVKRCRFHSGICLLCTLILLCTAASDRLAPSSGTLPKEEPAVQAALAAQKGEPAYRIALYGGQEIGVFSGEGRLLFLLVNVRSETLPDADRALLRGGIPLYSEEELCAVIADYTG